MKKILQLIAIIGVVTSIFVSMLGLLILQNRQFAYDNPSRVAAEAAALMESGSGIPSNTFVPMDVLKTSSAFFMVYDQNGKPIAGTGQIDNKTAVLPDGVIRHAKPGKNHQVSWAPAKNVKIATVTVNTGKYYVTAGQSLKPADERTSTLIKWWVVGFIVTLAVVALGFTGASVLKGGAKRGAATFAAGSLASTAVKKKEDKETDKVSEEVKGSTPAVSSVAAPAAAASVPLVDKSDDEAVKANEEAAKNDEDKLVAAQSDSSSSFTLSENTSDEMPSLSDETVAPTEEKKWGFDSENEKKENQHETTTSSFSLSSRQPDVSLSSDDTYGAGTNSQSEGSTTAPEMPSLSSETETQPLMGWNMPDETTKTETEENDKEFGSGINPDSTPGGNDNPNGDNKEGDSDDPFNKHRPTVG